MHTSIAGGLAKSPERAAALGCTTLQIFSHNPRSWILSDIPEDEARLFRAAREKLGLDPVFIHACYLINLTSANDAVRERSLWMLGEELRRADRIGADYVLVHTGRPEPLPPGRAHSGEGPGYEILVKSLISVLGRGKKKFRAGLLLENTACRAQTLKPLHGAGGALPASIKALSLAAAGSGAAGLCLDTCHAFASGYDIRTPEGIREAARQTADVKIRLIHLNDSKGESGSGLDRHEHIGKGKIGLEGFRGFLGFKAFRDQPLVLETPKKQESDDPMNIETARTLLANNRSQK